MSSFSNFHFLQKVNVGKLEDEFIFEFSCRLEDGFIFEFPWRGREWRGDGDGVLSQTGVEEGRVA